MNKEEIILLTNNFISYYEDGLKIYNPPFSFVDQKGEFIYDKLSILINKVVKKLNKKKVFLYYIDPDMKVLFPTSYDEVKEISAIANKTDLDNYLYKKVDTEEYEGRILSQNDYKAIVCRSKRNNSILSKVSKEMPADVLLCELLEVCASAVQKNNTTDAYLFFGDQVYFYYLFRAGEFSNFSYKNRLTNIKDDSFEDENNTSVEMGDLGTLLSVVGHIKSELKSTENANFNFMAFEKRADNIEEYLNTLAFKKVNISNDIFEFISNESSKNPLILFNEEKEKTSKKTNYGMILYYIIPFTILIFTAFKAIKVEERYNAVKNEYTTLSNAYEEVLSNYNSINEENEKIKKFNDSYNDVKEQYSFADADNIKSIFNEISEKYYINDVSVDGEIIYITIIADDGLKIDNFEVVRKTPYKDGFLYKMRSKND